MSDILCPHCRGTMKCPPELAGKWVACPLCQQQFILPHPDSAGPPKYASSSGGELTYAPARQASGAPAGDWLGGVKIPILISGIFNAILAVIWALTCFGLVLTIPLTILCVFEFVYYSQADTLHPRKAVSDGRTLGICEIVVGVLSLNTIVLVCGILAVVNANTAEQRLLSGR